MAVAIPSLSAQAEIVVIHGDKADQTDVGTEEEHLSDLQHPERRDFDVFPALDALPLCKRNLYWEAARLIEQLQGSWPKSPFPSRGISKGTSIYWPRIGAPKQGPVLS